MTQILTLNIREHKMLPSHWRIIHYTKYDQIIRDQDMR